MTHQRQIVAALSFAAALAAGACGENSPATPTPAAPQTPTRIIQLSGNLNFGDA